MSFSEYKKLLVTNPDNRRYYELITFSHSLISKDYHFVVDNSDLTIAGTIYQKSNIKIGRAITSNDLVQSLTFTVGDVDNLLDDELNNIPLDDTELPQVRYQLVLDSDLTNPVEDITFDVGSIPQTKGAFTIKTQATDLNKLETGDRYTFDQFPMLRTATL